MATPSDIRWGILGPGYIAELFAEDLASTPGARCVAVASRDAERARAFAGRHGIGAAYCDYAALTGDPQVDIVYIATPHSHHFEHARMMLEGGKPVLLEKPFTMNAAEAAELIALARQRGLFLMDAMWTLCNPLFRQLAGCIGAGDIGAPRAFSAQLGPIGVPKGHRVEDPALGGSYMLECLVYPMNILAGLAPNLMAGAKVTTSAVLSPRGVDTSAAIQLSNDAGVATMSGGFALGGQGMGSSGFHLIGDEGWLAVTDNLFNPGRAQICARGGAVQEEVETAGTARYRWEIEEAGRCLREGLAESALVPHDLTLGVMRVLDRAASQAKGTLLP